MIELGKRAVACEHWKPLLGMRSIDVATGATWRLCADGWKPENDVARQLRYQRKHKLSISLSIPDFSDALTAAGVIVVVRKAWKIKDLTAQRFGGSLGGNWTIGTLGIGWHLFEIEAQIAALECAPD